MLPENEYSEIESRYYLNPQVGLDESNKFIENLRSTQQQNTAQIAKDTAALGTEVSSNLGGLGGPESYFTSRYAVPQTNAVAANLRATAQAAALNEVLANEQAMWKKRYQDAYRNYQTRQYNRAYKSGGGGGTTKTTEDENISTWNGEIGEEEPTTKISYGVPGAEITETDKDYVYTDPNTGEKVYVSKEYMNKLYDENGNLTDEGAVILDTRKLLGL